MQTVRTSVTDVLTVTDGVGICPDHAAGGWPTFGSHRPAQRCVHMYVRVWFVCEWGEWELSCRPWYRPLEVWGVEARYCGGGRRGSMLRRACVDLPLLR
eukprot:362930-Chlamydomonas_euryale.AAC.8